MKNIAQKVGIILFITLFIYAEGDFNKYPRWYYLIPFALVLWPIIKVFFKSNRQKDFDRLEKTTYTLEKLYNIWKRKNYNFRVKGIKVELDFEQLIQDKNVLPELNKYVLPKHHAKLKRMIEEQEISEEVLDVGVYIRANYEVYKRTLYKIITDKNITDNTRIPLTVDEIVQGKRIK